MGDMEAAFLGRGCSVVRGGGAVGYAGAGGRNGAVQCKAQAGYPLVFQDALGQQSARFGAIAVACVA